LEGEEEEEEEKEGGRNVIFTPELEYVFLISQGFKE